MGKSTISMAIFNSYVKSPEGSSILGSIHLANWQFAIENGPLIVDLPIWHDDFWLQTVSLPKGKMLV